MNKETLERFKDRCMEGAQVLDLANEFKMPVTTVKYWRRELRKAGHQLPGNPGRKAVERPKP